MVKKAPPKKIAPVGRPVPPDAVRVWRGFRLPTLTPAISYRSWHNLHSGHGAVAKPLRTHCVSADCAADGQAQRRAG
jgi:hypothetical protein